MSDAPRQLPPKKEVALALLEGPSLLIHLDPRREGVVVPKWFVGQPQLVLQVGLNLPVPIPDLTVDEDGISCTLSFSRSPFWCHVPWSAVYALVGDDGRGMVWPDDVPPEVAAQMQKASSAPPPKAGRKPRAKLAAVDSSKGESTRPGPRSRSPKEPKSSGASLAESAEADGAEGVEKPRESAPPGRRGPRPAPKLAAAPTPTPAPVTPIAATEEPRDQGKGQKPRPVGPGESKKPKRELPPYLRVIK